MNQEQSSYNTGHALKVSVAKLQRYQRQTRRITIQTLKINPLAYD
jgi:hypothetical protein